jgi:ATP-dependent helicase Lhr and Lhr-like helicase
MNDVCTQLDWAHPLVRDWFRARFNSPTEPQEKGWPLILSGRTTLISAPTGSGKTLAAFLACIDKLVRKAAANKLTDTVHVVYVSPLKALSNDIQKNLEMPLQEISQLAAQRGVKLSQINVAVRTGDTLAHERQRMLKKPPHILVTTPESLYILLTAEKSRSMLCSAQTIIVDEIHAIADDKRGAHLALSLERLDALAGKKLNRIGLSATQNPIELVAQFLAGADAPLPAIVDVGHQRKLDLAVEVPELPLGPVTSNEMWEDIYKKISSLVGEHRSTLVFVNTRKLAERVAMNLSNILGADAVAAHHGSLSRKTRLEAERKLKQGEIKVLVATASLELGIDIGFVDLVCQISSPRSIATVLQRIGRAGHWRGAVPKGRLFATTQDELVEMAALVAAIASGKLDRLDVPATPLDVLAQQIVAMCAAQEWLEDELFGLIRRSYSYRELSRQQFEAVLTMLADGISARRGRYGTYLMWDRVNKRIKARRGARLAAITSGGAIPESNLYSVVAEPEETTVGTLDEDFAIESNIGDIILLGNTSWRIHRVESRTGRVLVEDAHGAAPTVPFWLGEGPSRTTELSDSVCEVRHTVDVMCAGLKPGLNLKEQKQAVQAIDWLRSQCGLSDYAAEQLVQYIVEGRAVLGTVPTKSTIVAERFFDEGGGIQLIIHAPFGARINKAWGLALRKKFCRSFNFELQASATDNGLSIALGEQHSFPLGDVFYYLTADTVKHTLEQAALAAPVFGTRWRWDAVRSLALLRFKGGKKVPPYLQRLLSDDLLAAVFPAAAACQDNQAGDIELPDHPLINEVMKDVLYEAMDLSGLEETLRAIAAGSIRCIAVDTAAPSVFSHEILNANPYAYLDDAPLEERRARAVELRRSLPDAVVAEYGQLDETAIGEVVEQAWPDVRDIDELHDFLLTVTALPVDLSALPYPQSTANWTKFLEELRVSRRATTATVGKTVFWVPAERADNFRAAYPGAQFKEQLPAVPQVDADRTGTSRVTAAGSGLDFETAVRSLVQGWMSVTGPVVVSDLQQFTQMPLSAIESALLQLESMGNVLRGKFTKRAFPVDGSSLQSRRTGDDSWLESTYRSHTHQFEFCDRRLLARIHSLTLRTLRKQIEPVSPAQFVRWLARWQHVAPGTQLTGEHGVLEVIKQLQGFELPANAWEGQVLACRVNKYNPSVLDQLCLSGVIGWGRLSPHPVLLRHRDTDNGNQHFVRDGNSSKAYDGNGRHVHDNNGSDVRDSNGRHVHDNNDSDVPVLNNRQKRHLTPTSVAPITFFSKEGSQWVQAQHANVAADVSVLSTAARLVYQFLKDYGASFFTDIANGTTLLKTEVETALWELVAIGYVTADGFDNMRALIDPRRRAGRAGAHRIRPRHSIGRWCLFAGSGKPEHKQVVESYCRILLQRYGVVFRDLIARETNLPSWRELLNCFRLLESRGEIRGGRFVSSFIGEQFALPEAVESLRLSRNLTPDNHEITLSAADPLNLFGIILPGERVPAISSKQVSLVV